MELENNSQPDSKAATPDQESAHQSRRPEGELPSADYGFQTPPSPTAQTPPEKKSYGWRENTKFTLEVIGLGVLITYTVFAGLQWLQIRWTNRLTREALNGSNDQLQQTLAKMQDEINQMSRLADNAGKQAGATGTVAIQAKRSANIAEKTLQTEERPWMGVDHIEFPTKVSVGSKLQSALIYRNWGKAPALHFRNQFEMHPYCGEFPKHPEYTGTDRPTPSAVMPNQVIPSGTLNSPGAVDQPSFDSFMTYKCGMYLYTRISYEDIAGGLHWRHWCSRWVPSTDNWQTCETYNDGDEDYKNGKEP